MTVADSGYYEAQRRGVEDQYAANMATNAYSRFLSQQRGNRGINLMQESFRRDVPRFTASFGQRGLSGGGIRSGTMQQSMARYLGDYTRDFSQAQQDLTEGLRQFDLEASRMGAQRTASLADIELAKAREIAFAAQNIEALRSMLGGL